jgi:hypothetical protein
LGACPGREGCAGAARNRGTAISTATRATVATFGTIAALTGIEHGVGEIVQGNRTPAGILIESWPDSALFEIVGGEPAMTIVPNLLLTGILTISVSLIVFMWTTKFVQRTHGGLILMLLLIILLLVGDGFGPPLLGSILGVAALGINARFPWWRAPPAQRPARFERGVSMELWGRVDCLAAGHARLEAAGHILRARRARFVHVHYRRM